MSSKLTALTESTTFSDSDQLYGVIDPGGSPLSRRIQSLTFQRYFPMGQNNITGLTLSNNGADANNDIDIAAGRVGAGTGDYNLILSAARTKQLDAAWVVGTNQGGLDTGAKAVSTWYHVWAIARVDTHVVDVLFSASATAPTMPASYTKKRRIGAIKTSAAGAILPFLQYGDKFLWTSPPALDVDGSIAATRANYPLISVPAGVAVEALMNVLVSVSTSRAIYFSNPSMADLTPSIAATPLGQMYTTTMSEYITQITDTSQNISVRGSGIVTYFRVAVLGWIDPRGKW